MSRPIGWTAAPLVALALLWLAGAALAAPANRLRNGDFETSIEGHAWMPAGWDTSRAGLPTVFFGRDTLLRHGGHYSASVANVSGLYPMSHNWSQRVIVGEKEWGKDLVFTVWTRTTSLDGRAYAVLQAFRDTLSFIAAARNMERDDVLKMLKIARTDDPLVSLGWDRRAFVEPETDWVRREMRVYCPPLTNVVFVRVGIQGTGQVLLDDASLTVEPARRPVEPRVGQNLLVDPGFEGDLTAWELSMPPFDGMRVARDTTEVHGGRASVVVSSGSAFMVRARTGVCQAFSNRALAGKRVRLTGWVKTDSLKSLAYCTIYAHTPRGVVQESQPQQFSRDTPWTLASHEIDIPPDATLVWAWFCHEAPRPGVVHWDDASFEVLGKAKTAGAPPRTFEDVFQTPAPEIPKSNP